MNRAGIKEKFPDITDEQLDWLMAQNGAAVKSAKDGLQAKLDAANAQVEALSTKVEEYDSVAKQNMSREEQLEAALKDMQAKQAETQRGYNRMSARSELSGLGLSDESVESILDMVVSDDSEATTAAAQAFAGIIKGFGESKASEAVKAAQASSPNPEGAQPSEGGITKEQFSSMDYSERLALFNESPEIYKELSKE